MSSITYFDNEGQNNLTVTMRVVAEAMIAREDLTAVIFTSQGEGLRMIANHQPELKERLIGISYPTGVDDEIDKRTESLHQLERDGFKLLVAKPPFREIMLPRHEDPKLSSIREALRLFGGGMILCVEAILMARDSDLLKDNQTVVAACSDTAIIATATRAEFLFYPPLGMEIQEILCKPGKLTISRYEKYQKDEPENELELPLEE